MERLYPALSAVPKDEVYSFVFYATLSNISPRKCVLGAAGSSITVMPPLGVTQASVLVQALVALHHPCSLPSAEF